MCSKGFSAFPSALAVSIGRRSRQVQSQHAGLNHPFRLHCAAMVTFSISITDADAEASAVLTRTRLDGLDIVPLPFEERIVQAWRRGAPGPGMNVETLQKLLEVCSITSQRNSCCAPLDARLGALLQPCSTLKSKLPKGKVTHTDTWNKWLRAGGALSRC